MKNPTYAPEFQRRMIELARSGRSVKELSVEFGVSIAAINKWKARYEVDHGLRPGVSSSENAELVAARKRIRQLEEELEITRKASQLFEGQKVSPKASSR